MAHDGVGCNLYFRAVDLCSVTTFLYTDLQLLGQTGSSVLWFVWMISCSEPQSL